MTTRELLRPYEGGDPRRSVRQLVETLALYGAAWLAMLLALRVSYALTLLLALPTAGLLVRLFIIQHDCGHGSFLPGRKWNDAVGGVLGVLTLTPYRYWRRFHALHHATSGKLEERGAYDINTLTVREYRALPRWRRAAYRIYRHPITLLLIAPALVFLVLQRLPWLAPREWNAERRSVLWTDLGIGLLVTLGVIVVGLEAVLLIQLPIVLLSSSAGMWLFYVQHQFEGTYWEPKSEWKFELAGLHGSSFLELPRALRWFTGDIGMHHIHHLNTRIPNYRLQACFDQNPQLHRVTRLSLRDSFRCFSLKLWDEDGGRMVGWSDTGGAI